MQNRESLSLKEDPRSRYTPPWRSALPCCLPRPRLPPRLSGHASRRRAARRVQPEAPDRPIAPLARHGEPRGPQSPGAKTAQTGPRARPGLGRRSRRRNLLLHRFLDLPCAHRNAANGWRHEFGAVFTRLALLAHPGPLELPNERGVPCLPARQVYESDRAGHLDFTSDATAANFRP